MDRKEQYFSSIIILHYDGILLLVGGCQVHGRGKRAKIVDVEDENIPKPLLNLGRTCYLNVAVQTLASLSSVRNLLRTCRVDDPCIAALCALLYDREERDISNLLSALRDQDKKFRINVNVSGNSSDFFLKFLPRIFTNLEKRLFIYDRRVIPKSGQSVTKKFLSDFKLDVRDTSVPKIKKIPVIFCLQLELSKRVTKRKSGGQRNTTVSVKDNNLKVTFEDHIVIEKELVEGSKQHSHYGLVSVIDHVGRNLKDAHYVAYVRRFIDGKECWYVTDDNKDALEISKMEVLKLERPEMLVYEHVKNCGCGI